MKILAIFSNGYEEIEALGTIALLKRSGLNVTMAGLHGTTASGKHDITISELTPLSNIDKKEYDALFIPGGHHYAELETNPMVKEIITFFMEKNRPIFAICAAPTILGKMGYLKGRNYTCFTSMNEDFGGTYIDQYVVEDGNLITARSAAASIDFAFAIIKKLQGESQEAKIKQQIYY